MCARSRQGGTAGVQTSGQLCTVGVEVEVQTGSQRSVNRGLGHWPGGFSLRV